MRFSDRTSNWIAGFGLGGFVGILLGVLPVLAGLLVAIFLLPVLRSRAPLAAVGGLLVGAPGFWLILIGRAALACREFDAQLGQECVGPDLTGWAILAGILVAIGIVLSLRPARA
ncbi:MAG TPA: hypothetical protein VFO78_09705 [Candidatus Limnocylindrales bacterium]|nr:hypothetical protein [Candidatus Limnocylindrales bacterium]